MIAEDTDEWPQTTPLTAQVVRFFAKLKKPARVPYDYREIERLKVELELKKAQAAMLGRFKAM